MTPEHVFNSIYSMDKILDTPKYDNNNNNSNVKTSSNSSSNNKNLNLSENICFWLIYCVQRKGVQNSLRCRSSTNISLLKQNVNTK